MYIRVEADGETHTFISLDDVIDHLGTTLRIHLKKKVIAFDDVYFTDVLKKLALKFGTVDDERLTHFVSALRRYFFEFSGAAIARQTIYGTDDPNPPLKGLYVMLGMHNIADFFESMKIYEVDRDEYRKTEMSV
jgi:hypothetical protein